MNALLRMSAAIDKLNEWIGRSAAWLGLAAVLVCTANALARYALNIGSNAWLELQWYFNSAVFLLIAAYALKRNEHVRIDVILGRLSPRAQAWIDILGGLFMLLPATIIIAWYSWPSLVAHQRVLVGSRRAHPVARARADPVGVHAPRAPGRERDREARRFPAGA